MSEEEAKQATADTLLLLLGCGSVQDVEELLRRPSGRGVEAAVRGLLGKIDPGRAAAEFRMAGGSSGGGSGGPLHDAREERAFRQVAGRWLSELEQGGALPREVAAPAVLVSPTVGKVVPLLWHLSSHALRCTALREAGVREQPLRGPAAPPSARALGVQVVARAREFVAGRQGAQREIAALQQAQQLVSDCCARLRKRLAKLRQLCEQRATTTVSQQQQEGSSVDALQDAWRRLEGLTRAAAAFVGEARAAAEGGGTKAKEPVMDGAALAFRVPPSLQRVLASVWDDAFAATLDRPPFDAEGRADLAVIVQLLEVMLRAKRGVALPAAEELRVLAAEWTTAAAVHTQNAIRLEQAIACDFGDIAATAIAETKEDEGTTRCDTEVATATDALVLGPPLTDCAEGLVCRLGVTIPPRDSKEDEEPKTPTKRSEQQQQQPIAVLPRTPTRPQQMLAQQDIIDKLTRSVQRISLRTATPKKKLLERLICGTSALTNTVTLRLSQQMSGCDSPTSSFAAAGERRVRQKLEAVATLPTTKALATTGTGRAFGRIEQHQVKQTTTTTAVAANTGMAAIVARRKRLGMMQHRRVKPLHQPQQQQQQQQRMNEMATMTNPFATGRQIPRTPLR